MMTTTAEVLREEVRRRYAETARSVAESSSCGCGSGSCCSGDQAAAEGGEDQRASMILTQEPVGLKQANDQQDCNEPQGRGVHGADRKLPVDQEDQGRESEDNVDDEHGYHPFGVGAVPRALATCLPLSSDHARCSDVISVTKIMMDRLIS